MGGSSLRYVITLPDCIVIDMFLIYVSSFTHVFKWSRFYGLKLLTLRPTLLSLVAWGIGVVGIKFSICHMIVQDYEVINQLFSLHVIKESL